MNFPLYLDIQALVLVELPHHFGRTHAHHQLHLVLVAVAGASVPSHVLYQVVLRDIDSCTSETQTDYKALCYNFASAVI